MEGSSMNRYWHPIIKPIIEYAKVKNIIEIGAEEGKNTFQIIEYCKKNQGKLSVIDPYPRFDGQALKNEYNDSFQLVQDFSLNALKHLSDYDAVLIDGDHNWYTVFHELKEIEKYALTSKNMPIVFFHDTEWPYGRRDMYYFPDTIPAEYRKHYSTAGVIHGQSDLSFEPHALNIGLNHALYEGGKNNGVLTAIEDFIESTSLNVSFHKVFSHNGLGILSKKNKDLDKRIAEVVKNSNL